MKVTFRVLLTVFLSAWLGTSVAAASKIEKMEECLQEEIGKKQAEDLLGEIASWLYISSPNLQEKIALCHKKLTGEGGRFIVGKGVQTEGERIKEAEHKAVLLKRTCELTDGIAKAEQSVASYQVLLDQAEEAGAAKQRDALFATVVECQDWAMENRRDALTNPVCSDLLREIGLPDTKQSGPSYQEVQAATVKLRQLRSQIEQKLADIDIIESEEMLPEEWVEKQLEIADALAMAMAMAMAEVDECEGVSQ